MTRLKNKACDADSNKEKTEGRLQYEEKYLEVLEKLESLKDIGTKLGKSNDIFEIEEDLKTKERK